MRKVFLILFFTTVTFFSFSQDIDFYLKQKNSNFELPQVNGQMSFSEYRLLSHDLRMMDMAYAAIVPGYVHFMAQDNNVGYAVLGVRMAGFATLGYLTYLTDGELTADRLGTNTKIAYGAVTVIIASYLFDWIHGKYRLEKKQDAIRYKYSVKASLSLSSVQTNPTIGMKISF